MGDFRELWLVLSGKLIWLKEFNEIRKIEFFMK